MVRKVGNKVKAILCFWWFLTLSQGAMAQAPSDSLIFDIPTTQSWQSPLQTPSSGFYLSEPSFLEPTIEYDPESKLYRWNNPIMVFD